MGSQRIVRRRPWLAGLLQLVVPGLGNLYSGRPARGLVLFLAARCVSFVSILALVWLPQGLNVAVFLWVALALTILLILDGVRNARAAKVDYTLARYNRWYVYILLAVVIGVVDYALVANFTAHIYQAFRMPSPAMEPALLPGDRFFANKTAYVLSEPRRGDLAIYPYPDPRRSILVHRIVGLPGETIEIRERVVFINGRKLDEPYVQFTRPPSDTAIPGDSLQPYMIPSDAYFLLGDNRDDSLDCRFYGAIKREDLLGRVTGPVYFSQDPENGQLHWSRIGKAVN